MTKLYFYSRIKKANFYGNLRIAWCGFVILNRGDKKWQK